MYCTGQQNVNSQVVENLFLIRYSFMFNYVQYNTVTATLCTVSTYSRKLKPKLVIQSLDSQPEKLFIKFMNWFGIQDQQCRRIDK